MAKTPRRSENGIVDAGALVALLNKDDPYHKWAAGQMSVADACLVRMSELEKDCLVFTTDTDFDKSDQTSN
jgi:predicted nucleic acid-binding protein